MAFFSGKNKKIMALVSASLITLTANMEARADSSTPTAAPSYLQQIAFYTQFSMIYLNSLPALSQNLLLIVMDWTYGTAPSQTTSLIQSDLTSFSAAYSMDTVFSLFVQPQIVQDIFGTNPVNYANDLAYQSLVGMPVLNPDPRPSDKNSPPINPAYNYLKNASGMSINHAVPDPVNWSGATADIAAYTSYYKTIMAVESFNAYAMSKPYVESNHLLFGAQYKLATDASSSAWFAQIMQETVGTVLRQILMFDSQIFVVLTQLLQTQKELLVAQSMTNSLLVLTGSINEQFLLRKAIQKSPGS